MNVFHAIDSNQSYKFMGTTETYIFLDRFKHIYADFIVSITMIRSITSQNNVK